MGGGVLSPDLSEELKMLKIELKSERDHSAHLESILEKNPDTTLFQKHILNRRMNSLYSEQKAPFAYGILQLDKSYQRIRHTRDRLKVLLYVTAERLLPLLGEDNFFQSDRSDEFIFIIEDYANIASVAQTVEDIILKVSEPHNPPASDIRFGCHVGVALYPEHGKTMEELEVNAEVALGIHKKKAWDGFMYTKSAGEAFHENSALEFAMRMGISEGFEGFHVAYQPIVDKDKHVVACEALMRWDCPGKGRISPEKFVALAEENGLINYLGKWILYQALRQVKLWRERHNSSIQVSVNVSAEQVEQDDFVEMIQTALEVMKVPGKALHIELTERSVMENSRMVRAKFEALQKLDVEVMLDDFGTGYSSLSVLRNLPINTLKIPKEFIDDIQNDPNALEVVRVIMSIAHTFGFTTLAEGIEDQGQFDTLIAEGCNYIQGYITSPPLGADDFEGRYLT